MSVSIPKALGAAMKKYGGPIGVRAATLTKATPGTRTPGSVSAGTNPTSASYPCRGMIEVLSISDMPNTLIQMNDRKISILGASLPAGIVPAQSDKVTIVDVDGTSKAFHLIAVISGDGVGAMFEFQARL